MSMNRCGNCGGMNGVVNMQIFQCGCSAPMKDIGITNRQNRPPTSELDRLQKLRYSLYIGGETEKETLLDLIEFLIDERIELLRAPAGMEEGT